MNNRDYKNLSPGNYYHIYNRGNGRMAIFIDDQDYTNFLKRLKLALGTEDLQSRSLRPNSLRIQPLPKESFSIIGYCLMPNHFHFLIKQNKDISISKLMTKVCGSYSKYFNQKYDKVGHLLQDKFKSVLIENNEYLLWLSAYIHQNPKVAGLVNNLKDYPWSSYPDYINLENKSISDTDIILSQMNVGQYCDFVEDSYLAIKERKIIDKLDIVLD